MSGSNDLDDYIKHKQLNQHVNDALNHKQFVEFLVHKLNYDEKLNIVDLHNDYLKHHNDNAGSNKQGDLGAKW